jgi:hypothetical protein
MVVTRGGFPQVVGNAFAGLGFPAEGPTVYEFPVEMFIAGSDLTPINENIDKIVYGLTKWEPTIKEKGIKAPPKVMVEGKDYQDAVTNMNLLFLKNLWGDGLPIVPATEESVNWILTGTDLSRDTIVGEGKVLPRGGIATVETLAVALAMAGGRPEYMPLLIAAVEAMLEPKFEHQGMNSTTLSNYPAFVVNGPIAKEIRLSSGYGCLGPNPLHPAGGPIGRAIRIILQDMGGGIPGIGSMAIYGGMRHTNAVFAEDEGGLPPDWEPISVEQGFPKGSNTVTLFNLGGMVNILGPRGVTWTAEVHQPNVLRAIAGNMSVTNPHYFSGIHYFEQSPGIVLLARGTAQGLSDLGWSKDDVKAFLWENSKVPDSLGLRAVLHRYLEDGSMPEEYEQYPMPITMYPRNIMIVLAGGDQSGHSYWMQRGNSRSYQQIKEIKLPANWDALLKEAEDDLGPLPAA